MTNTELSAASAALHSSMSSPSRTRRGLSSSLTSPASPKRKTTLSTFCTSGSAMGTSGGGCGRREPQEQANSRASDHAADATKGGAPGCHGVTVNTTDSGPGSESSPSFHFRTPKSRRPTMSPAPAPMMAPAQVDSDESDARPTDQILRQLRQSRCPKPIRPSCRQKASSPRQTKRQTCSGRDKNRQCLPAPTNDVTGRFHILILKARTRDHDRERNHARLPQRPLRH